MGEDNRILCDNCYILHEPDERCHCLDGLRDFFAGCSLTRIPFRQAGSPENIASSAYLVADAMLKARA